jgi:phosphorylcholine metabolism protein LicD
MERNKYGVYPVHHDEIKYSLRIIKKIFDKNNIHYWLEGGTLIAAVRDGDIFPWDNDGDISFDARDIRKVHALKPQFEKYGLYLRGFLSYRVTMKGRIFNYKKEYHLSCVMPSHIDRDYYVKTRNVFAILYHKLEKNCALLEKLDLTFLINTINKMRTYSFIRGKKEWIKPFAYVEFNDNMFPIPIEVEKYLCFRFGDWRTPDKYLCDRERGTRYHKRWKDI